MFGGPIAGWVADKWGRKISLVLCGLPYLLGYFLIVLASVAATPIAFKALLLAGRFITGIGMGWLFLAAPVSLLYKYLTTYLCYTCTYMQLFSLHRSI